LFRDYAVIVDFFLFWPNFCCCLIRKYIRVGVIKQIIFREFIQLLEFRSTLCSFLMMRIGTFKR
jgi:hypothetical protein